MNTNRVVLQPAFVLHSRPYRDTSVLVELLTVQYGRLTVIARGVRRHRSRTSGLFVPFLPLLVSFSGKTDLQSLSQIEANGLSYNLVGKRLIAGFYLNELLVLLLPQHDFHPIVFQLYQQTLADLANSDQIEQPLRLFEKCLLVELGYGLQLDRTINDELVCPNEEYVFEFGFGLQKVKNEKVKNPNIFFGKSLLALQNEKLTTKDELYDAKRLLRSILAILLNNKPLKSRELF